MNNNQIVNQNQIELINEDNVKLTRYQENLVNEIVKGHVEDSNYEFSTAKVSINKYFVAVSFYYYPKGHLHNPYVSTMKLFFIGKRGGIKLATVKFGIGEERNIAHIAQYYFKAEEN